MVLHFFHKTNITINWHRFTINSWSLMHTCSEYSQTSSGMLKCFQGVFCWRVDCILNFWTTDSWWVWMYPETKHNDNDDKRLWKFYAYFLRILFLLLRSIILEGTEMQEICTCLADASPHHIKSDIIVSMHRYRSGQDWWTSKDVVLLHCRVRSYIGGSKLAPRLWFIGRCTNPI